MIIRAVLRAVQLTFMKWGLTAVRRACAAGRGTESLTQSREVRRETSGPSDSPKGESQRGQEHVGKAGGIRRRLWSRPARPA